MPTATHENHATSTHPPSRTPFVLKAKSCRDCICITQYFLPALSLQHCMHMVRAHEHCKVRKYAAIATVAA